MVGDLETDQYQPYRSILDVFAGTRNRYDIEQFEVIKAHAVQQCCRCPVFNGLVYPFIKLLLRQSKCGFDTLNTN